VREPMILLLLAAGTIYLFLGDLREAIVLLSSVLVVIGISLYQNRRTERALAALRDLASPRALVIRGGRATPSHRIPPPNRPSASASWPSRARPIASAPERTRKP